ncbi:hypothetical protein Nepgr_033833 [Nepenthes gracilis]|uniref:Uncharacterized protein n=1 Tax=Nepenthes gracilis TaxID=150966 RepID=A0AAD3TMH9_NEPGR|nr:hypothetical protein Nepgr_033833 [Nepenthes gracilis]
MLDNSLKSSPDLFKTTAMKLWDSGAAQSGKSAQPRRMKHHCEKRTPRTHARYATTSSSTSVSSSGSVHSSKTCSIFPSLEKVYSSGNLYLDDLSTAVERGYSYAGPLDTPSKMRVQSSLGSPMADSGQVKKLVAGEEDQGIGKQRKNIEKIRLQLGASRARVHEFFFFVPELEDDVGMSGSEGFGTDIPSFLSGEGLSPATEGGGSQSYLKKPKRRKKKHQKGIADEALDAAFLAAPRILSTVALLPTDENGEAC